MLVVVKHRNVKAFHQRLLDFECTGGGDVLQVDATEGRGQAGHGLNDFLRILGVQADGEGIHPGKMLEQQRFALHHRHGRLGADVTQTEDCGAVGHDGHRIGLDGQVVRPRRILGDLHADPGHTRRVGHRQVIVVTQFRQRAQLDFAALVQVEDLIGPLEHDDAVNVVHRCQHLLLVRLAPAIHDGVLHQMRGLHLEPVERGDVGTHLADGHGQPAQHAGAVLHADTQAQ